MNRRSFLTAGGTVALAPLFPQETAPPVSTQREGHWLVDSAARAKALRKPLLVLHPIEPKAIWSHFRAYGSDQQLCPLAACEIVCATPAQIFRAFRSLEASSDPVLRALRGRWPPPTEITLLVDTDEPCLTFHGLARPRGLARTLGKGIDPEGARGGLIEANNAVLGRAFRRFIAPGSSTLYRRLEQYKRAHSGCPSGGFFPSVLRPDPSTRSDFIFTHAPSILRWIEQAKSDTTLLVRSMAEAVRCRLWHQSPPGPRWTYHYAGGPHQGRSVLEFSTSSNLE